MGQIGEARIKVIGVGGGGGNAVSRMYGHHLKGAEFICLNTDAQALGRMECDKKLRIGEKVTRGLGAGGDPAMGAKAADENEADIKAFCADTDMVFVTAGMGGGTGTGAAPVVAEIAKSAGALTIAVVTRPFSFEGSRRRGVADEGITRLKERADTVIAIPNDRLLDLCDHKTPVEAAFRMADEVLRMGVQAITEVITVPGIVNLDFADVRAIMKESGMAWMSIGEATGQNRAVEAAHAAITSPLLDVAVDGSKGVLLEFTGGADVTLLEVNEAAEMVAKAVDPDANIIFGFIQDPALESKLRVTLIATGFSVRNHSRALKQEEMRQMVQNLSDENELEVPSFLRRPLATQRQARLDRAAIANTRTTTPITRIP
ncbi:MAG: cell division protein FtsZ [Chloroflexi bacterium]|nr:cell division protein FtsZ [Chloroflexota bacterium]